MRSGKPNERAAGVRFGFEVHPDVGTYARHVVALPILQREGERHATGRELLLTTQVDSNRSTEPNSLKYNGLCPAAVPAVAGSNPVADPLGTICLHTRRIEMTGLCAAPAPVATRAVSEPRDAPRA
jgi:hypothetical protein